jgi:hypothetical protein
MDTLTEDEALRRRANAFLETLLEHSAGKSPHETACSITALAFEDGNNPLKALFTAKTSNVATPTISPPSPKDTLKSRSSRSILRIPARLKTATSEIRGPAHSSQEALHDPSIAGPSNSSKGPVRSASANFRPPSAHKLVGRSTSSRFRCIICGEHLSSKGVCKRHLEDQHVSPKVFKCEMCGKLYTVKADVKEHVKACGQGVLLYTTTKQEDKRLYGCEFTGKLFNSMTRFVEHLLALSERTEDRPTPDLHRKIYALLDSPKLQVHTAEISSRLYHSRTAWRTLQWATEDILMAIQMLEYANINDQDGTIDFGAHAGDMPRIQQVEAYMYSLLCIGTPRPSSSRTIRRSASGRSDAVSGTSSTSWGSSKTAKPTGTSSDPDYIPPLPPSNNPPQGSTTYTPSSVTETSTHRSSRRMGIVQPPVTSFAPEAAVHDRLAELKSKRHLSDHSRFFVPVRHPPGPPAPPPPRVPQMYDLTVHDSGHSTPVSSSSVSMPFSPPIAVHNGQQTWPVDVNLRPNYTPSLGTSESSDAASESTLLSNFPEPELVNSIPLDYGMWQHPANTMPYSLPYDLNHNNFVPSHGYVYSSSDSSRAASLGTDETFIGDYTDPEQKTFTFDALPVGYGAPYGSTFLLDAEPDDMPEHNAQQ